MVFTRINGDAVTKPITQKRETTYGIYPSYLFKEHDPILDTIDSVIAMSGAKRSGVAASAHLSDSTLRNWQLRKTKRPQFASITAVLRSLGAKVKVHYGSEVFDMEGEKT